jgi:hypothetical protein
MNCKEIKYFLLGCENPDQPPAEVKAHLAICAGCQDWQNRLAMIEMNVPFLPVPDSAARAQLLRTVRSQPMPVRSETPNAIAVLEPSMGDQVASDAASVGAMLSRPHQADSKPSPIRESMPPLGSASRGAGVLHFFRTLEPSARRYAAGAVAATILLAIFGWMVIRAPHPPGVIEPQTPHSSPDPLLASIVRQDLRLAKVDEPAERLLVLADLADDLSGEVKKLAPVPEAKGVLDDLVKRYEEVVRSGLLGVANKLPAQDRDELLNKIGERLHVAGREAEELGERLSSRIPNSSREALRRLTKVANEADERLRDLRTENIRQDLKNGRAADRAVLVQRYSP